VPGLAALSPNVQGAVLMSVSMAGYVLNDTLIKSVAGEVPLFQAILIRGLAASAMILALAWARGALGYRPVGHDRLWIGLRVTGEIGATCLFLTALFNMPLANATAILQVTSLVVTLSAALFLGDPVGWRRFTAIGVGFVGVLLIVRPGAEGFNAYSLAALGAVGFVVLRDLATRRLSPGVPGLAVTSLTAVAITALGASVTLVEGWQPVEPGPVLRLAGAALFLLVGYSAGIQAMRTGEVAFVSPFRYLNLIWALLLGFVVFGDLPGPLTLLGAGLIVGAGLYTLYRERRVLMGRPG